MPRTPILHQPRTLPAQENKTSPKPRNQDTVKRLPGPRLAQKTYSQNSTSSAKKHASDDAPPSGTRRKEVTRKLFLRDKWGGETDGENDGMRTPPPRTARLERQNDSSNFERLQLGLGQGKREGNRATPQRAWKGERKGTRKTKSNANSNGRRKVRGKRKGRGKRTKAGE
ncbi:hypothetical protein EYR40_007201 [Pleurotus pulmonarius]|nr:hypothetical protein EYR40_007201 [Pleurotus pulmonarius]